MNISPRSGQLALATSLLLISIAGTRAAVWPAPRASLHHTLAAQNTANGDRVECPGPELELKVGHGSTVTINTVPVAGPISQVPEFHDCQRFVHRTAGEMHYGALYAVFASFRLDSLIADLDTAKTATKRAVAAAEIYTKQGNYQPLGIKPGFNCLYLTDENGWQYAYMVALGPAEAECTARLETSGIPASATKLNVRRTRIGTYADADYPPVARWMVVTETTYQVGIKCGAAWCEVGVPASSSSATAVASSASARVQHIPGWYDAQRLAVHGSDGSLSVLPGRIRATVRPSADLASVTAGRFDAGWVQVGTIELADNAGPYQSKLGVTKGINRLFLRHDVQSSRWSARIDPATGPSHFYQVTRHGHEGTSFKVPGTLRWRWLPNDETIWARCLEGCCQVQPGDG